jgi:hypothetical protein
MKLSRKPLLTEQKRFSQPSRALAAHGRPRPWQGNALPFGNAFRIRDNRRSDSLLFRLIRTSAQNRRREMWLVRFRVIDIETTGLAPPAEIIEIGRVDVVIEGGRIFIEQPLSRLYRPLHGIPPETMAVHHITEADVPGDTSVCNDDLLISAVRGSPTPDALVAHNCSFEQQFIPAHITGPVPWICTHKIALRIWPNAPRHSNQVLRYWRRLSINTLANADSSNPFSKSSVSSGPFAPLRFL